MKIGHTSIGPTTIEKKEFLKKKIEVGTIENCLLSINSLDNRIPGTGVRSKYILFFYFIFFF